MKSDKRTIVDIQKLKSRRGDSNSRTRYVAEHGESELADPGILLDLTPEQSTAPSSPQMLMGEAVEHLQGRQKEVYTLHMRCDLSLGEIAEVLTISKGAAQTYLGRAVKFVETYCHQAILRGRV